MIKLQTELFPGMGGSPAPTDSTLVNAANGIAELKTLSLDDLIARLAKSAVDFAINIAIAIFVFYVGRFIIKKIYRLISTVFIHRNLDKSLATFILSMVNIVLYFILIVTVIGILGIETTSFLALFASAGVAIGMALSGTLQNFAGGVLILLLKPYKIGDYIEVQGYAGTVREIQIFHTIITTYDNKSILIPNGGLSTGSVNNWSREDHRRVTWTVSISYGDDVDKARKAILEMFAADERIEDARPEVASDVVVNDEPESDIASHPDPLKLIIPKPDHSPKVFVDNLASSSVDLTVRAWTKTGDYWDVYYYYNEKFYNELPDHGINFPFPQMDVHLSK